ncbi:hypothetical protein [Tellurirhabdus bombi]|uniref:hypothetical protein n=1 Tax=Tellurirhabdus bombi TaxID=2907205 RepID=UPI001F1EB80B|nr:hypothetical protein [Tellurirhabdus bombi]
MDYNSLDINEKINTKAVLSAWAKYSVDHFKEELQEHVYGRRMRKGNRRSGQLKRTWYQAASDDRVVMNFLLYGRFLDMGVGFVKAKGRKKVKGLTVTHTDRIVARQLKEGRTGRTRRPWYSKRKTYEVKRLREELARLHVTIPLEALENTLSIRVNVPL